MIEEQVIVDALKRILLFKLNHQREQLFCKSKWLHTYIKKNNSRKASIKSLIGFTYHLLDWIFTYTTFNFMLIWWLLSLQVMK